MTRIWRCFGTFSQNRTTNLEIRFVVTGSETSIFAGNCCDNHETQMIVSKSENIAAKLAARIAESDIGHRRKFS